MATEFKMPEVGENIESADIGQIFVAEGDTVEIDQDLMEVETEKAVVAVPSPYAGTIASLKVSEGDTVKVGEVVLTIDEADGGKAKGQSASNGRAEPGHAPEAEQAEKAPAKDSVPATPKAESSGGAQTGDKRSAAAQSKAAPAKPQAAPSGGAQTGDKRSGAAQSKAAPAKPQAAPSDGDGAPVPAGPATRRYARELGVNLRQVAGSGPGGRIDRDDVQAFVQQRVGGGGGSVSVASKSLPDFGQFGTVRRQKMNKVARTAMDHLTYCWQTIPHVTQHDLADVTELEAGRKRQGKSRSEGEPKVTMTVLAMKAAVAAMKEFPKFNSSLDAAAGELVMKDYFHIGVAVDTDNGLLVPVIRDVDRKTTLELAAELGEVARKARDRELGADDFKGGCFTISNLGGIGGVAFTPIVNSPEVAILGLSRASQQMTMHEGSPQMRLTMPLSLSYDHRVINGADAARFAAKLCRLFSDPFVLMSEV